MKQKSLPAPRLRLSQLLGKHRNEAAHPRSLPRLFPTHAHAHPQPRQRFPRRWGGSSQMAGRGSARCRCLQAIDPGCESGVDSLQHSCLTSQFILDQCFVGYMTVAFQIWYKKEDRKLSLAVLVNLRSHCRAWKKTWHLTEAI